MQSFEKGRTSDISCACHWTVNVAAAKGHGKLYGDAYSVSPCGVFVPPDSKITSPEQLAGVPISVGYQSGSHYATIQALEQYMPLDQINLSYKEGMLFARMDLLFEGKIPACTLFSGPYYFAEQLGFRKVTDCTFMMATHDHRRSRSGGRAQVLPRAQARAARHRSAARALHALLQERVSQALSRPDGHAPLGPGERIVFEPYSQDIFEESRDWIRERGIFEGNDLGAKNYESAVVRLAVLNSALIAEAAAKRPLKDPASCSHLRSLRVDRSRGGSIR